MKPFLSCSKANESTHNDSVNHTCETSIKNSKGIIEKNNTEDGLLLEGGRGLGRIVTVSVILIMFNSHVGVVKGLLIFCILIYLKVTYTFLYYQIHSFNREWRREGREVKSRDLPAT